MADAQRYKTAGAFRQSLEERLNQISRNQGVDLTRLRRRVAFERLLARLFTDKKPRCILKGGYAIELRFQNLARATRDIDLSIPDPGSKIPQGKNQSQGIREWLQEELDKDLGDWFVFFLGEKMSDLRAAPQGGTRFQVEARLDNRTFARFTLDAGIGDAIISEPEWVTGHELLSFAGISPARIAVLPLEQQFAEKIHAYTLPRERTNSRTRDLIDLVLLIEQGLPQVERVVQALRATFERRATHPLPNKLEPPPESWREPYAALAADYNIRAKTIETAHDYISAYWNQLGA
ncbi:MAG: nucleotidyl transferase AbiEii/AbiGii toxin family protein [Nitrospirae bacterium]|nr:nucleotidyl transferase AbiEii/AbiGii toxin family protein [Nitrospirota bacterium]